MKKKITVISLIVALAAIVVAGSLAYFTNKDSKTNVFTMGKGVIIDLNEDYKVPEEYEDDPTWKPGEENPEKPGAIYSDVTPGIKYAKNVSISVDEDSRDAYVFAELVVNDLDKLLAATGISADNLDQFFIGGEGLKAMTPVATWQDGNQYHIVFGKAMVKEENWQLFKAVTIPKEIEVDYEKLDGGDKFELTVNAYAIQKDTFTTLEDAWQALKPQ